ncbi:hypothetical protein [Cohnella cellulosilytica]|uniref:hypothetical protein n=1 Tax=Cohnella cellulosilytica TaxID=986710 RepID=UPI0036109C9F
MIKHTRIRVVAGKVEEGPLQYSGGYSKAQGWTDIRIVELPPAAVRAARYIYSKGSSVPAIAAKQAGDVLAFNASYVDVASGRCSAGPLPTASRSRRTSPARRLIATTFTLLAAASASAIFPGSTV